MKKFIITTLLAIVFALPSFAQTENIDQIKTKKLNLGINLQKRSQSKKPLSVLLTQLIHNNTQNVRKVINLKSKDGKKK